MSHRTIRIAGVLAVAVGILVLAHVGFFYWRDNFSTHFPLRTHLAERFRALELPLWNPWVGGGQPLAGNPNTLTFYPDFPLSLVFSEIAAFNLHYLLHWILGGFGAALLFRVLEFDRRHARLGAAIWLSCGTVLSMFAFYNLITAVAWIPFALAAAEWMIRKPGWRPALLLGCSFGLLTLAGEPVTLFATAFTAAALGIGRVSRAGLAWVAAATLLAATIASPLVLAWSEIAGEVERGASTYSAATVLNSSLSPWQLAEIVLGPMRGLATDYGPGGYFGSGLADYWPPLLQSVFLSALVIPALLLPAPPLRRMQITALILLAAALGRHNPLVEELVGRVDLIRFGRYPEKLAIPATLLLVVLVVGWIARPRRSADRIAAAGGVLFAAGVAALVHLASVGALPIARLRILTWSVVAAGVLSLAIFVPERHRFPALSLAVLAPLLVTGLAVIPIDWAAPYRMPSALAEPLVSQRIARLVDEEREALGFPHARARFRFMAAALDPVWGVPLGVGYGMDRSPDGMFSMLSRIVQERFVAGDDATKARLARVVGVSAFVTDRPMTADALDPVASARIGPRTIHLYAMHDPLPPVLPVANVEAAATVNEAVARLESAALDPTVRAMGPAGFARSGSIRVEGFRRIADGWRIETETASDAALLVNESYFRAWRAEDQDGRELGIFPIVLDRLGVAVPAGTTEVTVRFGRRRIAIALAWAASLAVLAASVLALAVTRRREGA